MSSAVHIPRPIDVRLDRVRVGSRDLSDVLLRGYAYGPPLGTAPVVMIVGGITASPFPFGGGIAFGAGTDSGWWPALRQSGLVDLERHTVLCPAHPGNGTGWSGLDEVSYDAIRTLPRLSVLDLAELTALWLDGLGVSGIKLWYVGASLGGLVGMALAARHPDRVERLASISAGLRPDGWGTGSRHLQRALVLDGLRNGDAFTGMVRARQMGMLTYRGREELDTRFGVLGPEMQEPPVAKYLDHNGRKFAETFPVQTFMLLSEAIDRCHLAGSAAGIRTALEAITAEVTVVGVPGDLLFPWALQTEMHRELQACGANSSLWKLDSAFGHDAFLADQDKLALVLKDAGVFREGPTKTGRFDGVGSTPVRVIRLGLVGCGVVGKGLLELLDRQRASLVGRYGVAFEVTRMAVRDLAADRGPYARGIARTADPLGLVAASDVDVVVEVAGGVQSMRPVLTAALAAGKPVVTANKALLANHLAELGVLSHRTGTPLACEAAAAAALPIIRALNHRSDDVRSLLAIVNGTNNFILTRLEEEQSFDQAVEEAQRLGLAEADPTADVDGFDAAAKLSILAYRSFGAWVPPDAFPVRGIRGIAAADCDLAEAMGFRIRHLARAAMVDGALDLAVEPLLLPNWHLLASVEEEYNAVYLECESAGDLSFFGKGAGGLPTATAVLSDLIDLAQDNSATWPTPKDLPRVTETPPRRHFLRITGTHHPGLARRVETVLRRLGVNVHARATCPNTDQIHLGFITRSCPDTRVQQATDEIRRLGRVDEVAWLGVMVE